MGNKFGACSSELQSFKLEDVENGYWIVVGPGERLSVDRDEPLPQSRGSSIGFKLSNSLMIMQVTDPDLLDAGLTAGSWIAYIGDTPEELHSNLTQKRKVATVDEFRRRTKDKSSFGLIVRPPWETHSYLITGGKALTNVAFTVHPSTMRVLCDHEALSNKRVTHVNGIVVDTFEDFQKAREAIIQNSSSYWLTVSRKYSLSLQEIITEIERFATNAPLYCSTVQGFDEELCKLLDVTSDIIALVRPKLTNQEPIINQDTISNSLPIPPVLPDIDRETHPDLYALKQIELLTNELKGFHHLPSLTSGHVDRVAELEIKTEEQCQVIAQVLKELESNISQTQDCHEFERLQEKYDNFWALYQKVIGTYRKIKERLPPPDDAGRERQQVLNTISMQQSRLRDGIGVDIPPTDWPPPNTTKKLREYLRDYEQY